jgi:hypothetical protein
VVDVSTELPSTSVSNFGTNLHDVRGTTGSAESLIFCGGDRILLHVGRSISHSESNEASISVKIGMGADMSQEQR